jgi:hypothetical protein
MPTILRQDGFAFMIFTNDHEPPHVHVCKGGAEAVINLDPVSIRENYRMAKKELRKAKDIVEANRSELLQAWEEIHGDAE